MSTENKLQTWEQTRAELSKFTNPLEMIDSEMVRNRFVKNYELASGKKDGILAYQSQFISFRQCIQANTELAKCTIDSLYKCFIQAAIRGYSLDAADQQCYMYPYGAVATLQPQAGAFIEKLKRNKQISHCDQVKFVYQGDVKEIVNGKVIKHIENFASEIIELAYIRMTRIDGTEIYFIYRPSDWAAWRSKSKQKDSENWKGGFNGQPMAAFLRTKVTLHAAKEKIWSPSNTPIFFEKYDEVEVIEDEEGNHQGTPIQEAQYVEAETVLEVTQSATDEQQVF